ncbi:MAG: hypothetical protein WCB57_09495 [Pseudonocardiaceae bacterium]
MQGIDALVVVMVVQGTVWVSISPPFSWEAIMEPGKVDELMHVLRLAREEAQQMPTARGGRAADVRKAVVSGIASGPATH